MTTNAVPPRRRGPAAHLARGIAATADSVSAVVGGVAILAMTALVTVDVVGRYAFGKPLGLALEFSGYGLVALIFFGLAHTERCDRHIAITVLTDRLPLRARQALALTVTLASAALVIWLVWFTLQPALQDRAFGTVSLTGTRTPLWIPQLAIPVGFALFAILLVRRAVMQLIDFRSVTEDQRHAV